MLSNHHPLSLLSQVLRSPLRPNCAFYPANPSLTLAKTKSIHFTKHIKLISEKKIRIKSTKAYIKRSSIWKKIESFQVRVSRESTYQRQRWSTKLPPPVPAQLASSISPPQAFSHTVFSLLSSLCDGCGWIQRLWFYRPEGMMGPIRLEPGRAWKLLGFGFLYKIVRSKHISNSLEKYIIVTY